uniref:Uncharacterized protein n=1 Tax=Panagrolaimus davidi TaxID=227884 RepID=A0A914P9Z0_9BILA
MSFPFKGTSFSTLKNKYYTPMNTLLARIIERSNWRLAFEFSVINKTLKNENDRHPIKPEHFVAKKLWTLRIRSTNFDISPDDENSEKYFNQIKNRKNYVDEENGIVMGNYRLFPQIEESERYENGVPAKFIYTFSQALEALKIMELRDQDSTNSQEYAEDRPLSPLISL